MLLVLLPRRLSRRAESCRSDSEWLAATNRLPLGNRRRQEATQNRHAAHQIVVVDLSTGRGLQRGVLWLSSRPLDPLIGSRA